MGSRWLAVSVAALGLGVSLGGASAHAQDTQKVQKPFSVKVGAFFPSDGDTKDAVGSTFLYAGLAYDIAKSKATAPTLYQIYFDYATKKKSYNGFDLEGRVLGVGPAAKFLLAPATAAAQPYVGVGLGYYNVKIAASSGGVTVSRSESRFGGKLFAGYQLKGGFFGEADYSYIAKIDGSQPGGAGVRLGYRF